MKKSFFKKLSFVLALAMIVSVIAPASGAFAAASPAINTAKKYLFLGETGKNEYDFHIDNKVKGSTYKWSSSDENVAVVDAKTGYTTAVANGTATITCKVKTKKKTYTSTTSVIVKNNIKTLAISQKPDGDKLAVGKSNTFGTTFTTFGGTQNTTSVVKWAVADKDGKATTDATITDKGEFSATKAGTYTVVAAAFQSAAKFASFASTQDAKLVLAKDTTTVTVAPSIVSTTQVDKDTFTVKFDTDMSKTDLSATTATVAQVISGKNVTSGAEKIKKLSLDATGTIATVDLYATVSEGTVYSFTYGKLTGTFTSAKKAIANIASIQFDDFNASIGTATSLLSKVKLLNSDGVVIYTGDETAVSSYLSFAYTGDTTKASVVSNNGYWYKNGYQGTVTATFNAYVLNSTTNKYDTVKFTDSAVGTGVSGTAAIASTLQFEIVQDTANTTETDATWTGALKLAATDKNYVIKARYNNNNNSSSYVYDNTSSILKYTSSDTSKLTINGTSVYAYAAGTVTVIVKDTDGNTVTTFDITIDACREVASATADVDSIQLGNNGSTNESKTVTVALVDTVGDPMYQVDWGAVGKEYPGSYVVESQGFINKPAGAVLANPTVTYGSNASKTTRGKIYLNFTAANATVGVYQYKLVLSHNYSSVKKEVIITVIVLDGKTNTAVSYYKVDLDKNVVNMAGVYNATITARLNGYNTENAVVSTLRPGTDYTYNIKNTDGVEVTTGCSIGVDGKSVVIKVTDGQNGKAVNNVFTSYWATTSYSFNTYVANVTPFTTTGNNVIGAFINSTSFGINLDITKSFTPDKPTVVSGTSLLAAVSDCFSYTLNGTKLTPAQEMANINAVEYTIGNELTTNYWPAGVTLTYGNQVYITKVFYKVVDPDNSGSYINYEFDLNTPIQVTAN